MDQHADSRPASASIKPLWLTNPMDWRPIDRFILLASLVLLAPLCFGTALLAGQWLAPDYFDPSLARALLWLYGVHLTGLGLCIGIALKRRQDRDHWPWFESVIIGSYIITVMASAWMVGAHFAEGLLLLFLGVNITCTLASVDKIRLSYWFVVPTLVVMAILDFTNLTDYAPLMERSLFQPDGKPVIGWLAARAVIAGILSALIYLCILAVRRWVERENLYREMSSIDGLTRLSNRNSLIQRGQEEVARIRRNTSPPPAALACIMIDLDHFKRINDTWGHHAGDAVLVAASKIMMENARQYDEVGRYGGEEFAVLLPGVTVEQACAIAERLRIRISKTTVVVDDTRIDVTASLGVACYPSAGIDSMNDLLKAADAALYRAKANGRNRVEVATMNAATITTPIESSGDTAMPG